MFASCRCSVPSSIIFACSVFQLSISSEVRLLNVFGLSLLRGLGHWVVAGFVIEEIGHIGQVFASYRCSVPSFIIFACSAFQLSILSEVRLLNFFGLSLLRGLGHWVVAGFVIEEIGKFGQVFASCRCSVFFIFACSVFQLSISPEVRLLNFFGLSLLCGLGHWVVAGYIIEAIGHIGQVFASCRCSVPSFVIIFACSAFQLSI